MSMSGNRGVSRSESIKQEAPKTASPLPRSSTLRLLDILTESNDEKEDSLFAGPSDHVTEIDHPLSSKYDSMHFLTRDKTPSESGDVVVYEHKVNIPIVNQDLTEKKPATIYHDHSMQHFSEECEAIFYRDEELEHYREQKAARPWYKRVQPFVSLWRGHTTKEKLKNLGFWTCQTVSGMWAGYIGYEDTMKGYEKEIGSRSNNEDLDHSAETGAIAWGLIYAYLAMYVVGSGFKFMKSSKFDIKYLLGQNKLHSNDINELKKNNKQHSTDIVELKKIVESQSAEITEIKKTVKDLVAENAALKKSFILLFEAWWILLNIMEENYSLNKLPEEAVREMVVKSNNSKKAMNPDTPAAMIERTRSNELRRSISQSRGY